MRQFERLHRILLCFVVVLATITCIPMFAWGDDLGFWTVLAPMPTARQGLAIAAVNDKIYAIGGLDSSDGSFLSTVEEYNPATNAWRTVAPMPTGRYSLAAAVVNDRIYAIGGYGVGFQLTTVEEYNPFTDTWRSVAPMPTARNYLAAVVVNDRIYAIGGADAGVSGLTSIEEYNPATDTWRVLTPMPTARYALAAAVVNDRIYVIGGWAGCCPLSTVEEYNPIRPQIRKRCVSTPMAMSVSGRRVLTGSYMLRGRTP